MRKKYLSFAADANPSARIYYAVFRESIRRIARKSLKKLEMEKRGILGKDLAGVYWSVTHGGIGNSEGLRGPLRQFFEKEYAAFMAWQDELGYQFSAKPGNRDGARDYLPAVDKWLGGYRVDAPRSKWFIKAITTVRFKQLIADVKDDDDPMPLDETVPSEAVPTEAFHGESAEEEANSGGSTAGCWILALAVVGFLYWWRSRS